MKDAIITKPYLDDPSNRRLDITNKEHHSMDCISASRIKAFLDKENYTNLTWYMTYVTREMKTEFSDATKKSMFMGTLTHLALLEPMVFENTVHTYPMPSTATNEFKSYVKEKIGDCIITNEGGIKAIASNEEEHYFVTPDTMTTLSKMIKNVYKNPNAMSLLDNGECETSGVVQCDITGEFLSVRDDCRGEDFILDVKKIKKLTKLKIERQIDSLRYWVQDVHYRRVGNLIEGANRYKKFLFLFVEEEEPYQNRLVSIDLDYRKDATAKYVEALKEIKSLAITNGWEGTEKGILINRPKWGLK